MAPAAVAEVVETQSVCAGGVAQSATIVLPVDDAGVVTYAADPASAPEDAPDGEYAVSTLPQTVTVTATLDPAAGLVWGDVGDSTGTAGSANTLTLSVPLDAAPESCTVAPAAVAEVVETQSVCAGGVAQSATIVLPVDDAGVVTYAADPACPGGCSGR